MRKFLIYCLFMPLGLLQVGSCVADDPRLVRELWVGEFVQEAPRWKGRMELYIKYRSGETDPRSFEGVITWPDLGNKRTSVVGDKSWETIRFKETGCLSGACSPLILGGGYHGEFNKDYSTLEGTAVHSEFKLEGSFELERVEDLE